MPVATKLGILAGWTCTVRSFLPQSHQTFLSRGLTGLHELLDLLYLLPQGLWTSNLAINPFYANGLFLYPLETSERSFGFLMFSGGIERPVVLKVIGDMHLNNICVTFYGFPRPIFICSRTSIKTTEWYAKNVQS